MPRSGDYLDTPSPFDPVPDYPAEAVAFLYTGTNYSTPVPADVDPVEDAPPDAEVRGGNRPKWVFGNGDVLPANVVPERVWKHVYDRMLPVDADGNAVGGADRPEAAREPTDAEAALERYRLLHEDGETPTDAPNADGPARDGDGQFASDAEDGDA